MQHIDTTFDVKILILKMPGLLKMYSLNNMMSNPGCKHLKLIQEDIKPSADGCEDCLKIGDSWVHLRLCLICGHVGCCDSSKNKHATKHFHLTSHPIVQSFEPDEDWRWCFVDQTLL